MDVAAQKRNLRSTLIKKRNTLLKKEWEEKSREIFEHVLNSSEYKESEFIHCFVSMNHRFEINTHLLIQKILDEKKRVIVPITDFTNNMLTHSYLRSFDDLTVNKWGVLEPKKMEPVPISKIELVLLPLLGVDREGNRLGYGKGFYDRFLSKISIPTFGLIFDDFIIDEIPTENFDIPVHGFISENGVYMCNNERNAS